MTGDHHERRGAIGTIGLLASGLAAFGANLATIASTLGGAIEVRGTDLLEILSWDDRPVISDGTFVLVTALYACIALVFSAVRSSPARGFRIALVLPPLLVAGWAFTYTADSPWVCLTVVLLCELWPTWLLPIQFVHSPKTNSHIALNAYIAFMHPVLLVATTAGTIRFLWPESTLAPWLTGLIVNVVAIAQLWYVIGRDSKQEAARRAELEALRVKRKRPIAADIRRIVEDYAGHPDFHASQKIPNEILFNAKRSCVVPTTAQVFAVIDCTSVMKHGKKAVVFTEDCVYYNNGSQHGAVMYFTVAECGFEAARNGVFLLHEDFDGGRTFLPCDSDFSSLGVVRILDGIKAALT